jgi:uncharacterized protein YraI
MFKRKLLAIAAFLGALSIPGVAMAASIAAITTADLNIRVGPGVSYARFGTIPYGDNVRVHGCISGYNWCDVSWAGTRGWVSGNYLAYLGDRYYRRSLPSIAVAIGLPIIGYDYDDYYDRYYVGRHFNDYYFDRYRHHRRAIRREHRQEVRENRRERRQEVRQERRERRHEIRQDRRQERRQEVRQNRRERRHEARQERRQEKREMRRERRQERRQERRERRAN